MDTAKRALYLVLALVASQCATTADTDAQPPSNPLADGILRAEITQTQQLRQLAEAQQRQIQSLEAQLHVSCDVLWQMDAYMHMQDFSNGDSGEIALKYLKQLGFQPSVVFDIGANTGESAKLLTSLWGGDAGRPFTLHSFEPVPPTFKTLSLTIRRAIGAGTLCDPTTAVPELGSHNYCELENRDANVRAVAHNVAVSNSVGTVEIYDGLDNIENRKTRSAWATLAQKGTSYGKIPSLKVDTLLYGAAAASRLPSPQLIKCDTEGWDYMVLEGMQEMLAAGTAEVLLFEVGDNWARSGYAKANIGNAVALLVGAGYDAFLLGDTFNLKLSGDFFQPLYNSHRWGNMLAIRRGSALLPAMECLPLENAKLKRIPYTCGTRPACS